MARDYLPDRDTDLQAWMTNFIVYAGAHLADLGLVAADLDPVSSARDTFDAAMQDHVAKQDAAQAARQLKDGARAAMEVATRALVRRLQASAAVSDDERQALGITVRDGTRTQSATPVARPEINIESGERLRHTVGVAVAGTPSREAKPAGAIGAEIWMGITAAGAAPPPIAQFAFVGMTTRGKHVVEHDEANAGKTAHYAARFVSTRGDKGPWSETASATIGG